MESLAFWPVFGLIVTVFIWASSRERIERQKTLQRMLERNEEIDEELVNKLLERRGFSCKPGDAYRYLRAIGAFGMIVSIPVGGLAFAAVVAEDNTPMAGAIVAGTVFFLVPFFVGLAFFLSSGCVERPDRDAETT